MAEVQNAIYRAGLRASASDAALVRERHLDPEYRIACTVAEREGRVIGFQSLKRAWPGNPYDVGEGWGIIGTHIHPEAGRTGLGRRLFATSLAAAKAEAHRREHRQRQLRRTGLLRGHGLHAAPGGKRHHPAPLRRPIPCSQRAHRTPRGGAHPFGRFPATSGPNSFGAVMAVTGVPAQRAPTSQPLTNSRPLFQHEPDQPNVVGNCRAERNLSANGRRSSTVTQRASSWR
ncbi:GNAT family N-acetyltransferase [Ornithinimicrobium faecis]|uniref:GNAT family N-acetyltransferase n=2 Tax=Ornithinimicrobium faecis TaxID=2934158 RepID=A0ABY4YZZ5_9MICO|nr:GNAT family N-acetyltransferase [Ornithinimicrobium sp. HY1793]USQ82285.1 GNAT family N-acetyltransferase [Ornithinimicrobium sp. HY1793]